MRGSLQTFKWWNLKIFLGSSETMCQDSCYCYLKEEPLIGSCWVVRSKVCGDQNKLRVIWEFHVIIRRETCATKYLYEGICRALSAASHLPVDFRAVCSGRSNLPRYSPSTPKHKQVISSANPYPAHVTYNQLTLCVT